MDDGDKEMAVFIPGSADILPWEYKHTGRIEQELTALGGKSHLTGQHYLLTTPRRPCSPTHAWRPVRWLPRQQNLALPIHLEPVDMERGMGHVR
jgi:hypothetical protein